jgi:adenosylcobinamide-phosphate synthase
MTTISRCVASAAGIALGYLADELYGDPRRFHPIAGFGWLGAAVERRCYADSKPAGALYAGTLVAGAVALGLALDRLSARHALLEVLVTGSATWAVLGGRSLRREASIIAWLLAADDLPAARQQIRNLVGRDPSQLGCAELARACVESLAENTSDAVIAPLVWGAVAGVPGLLGYRAVNTLDAMVGHRSPRYISFGWAAARLDDVANWVPARLAAALTLVRSRVVGGSRAAVWQTVRRDAARHPSPNAGVAEAAFAGALCVRLGGRNVYQGRLEDRGLLGEGRDVHVTDIARASRLSQTISVAAVCLAAGFRAIRGFGR